MSEKLVKKVMTKDGVASIDYLSLANLPTIDDTVLSGSTNAVQSHAVYNALEGKLDSMNGKAADAYKLNGQPPEYYATASAVQTLTDTLNLKFDPETGEITGDIDNIKDNIASINNMLDTKLDANAQAVDSAKLGGQKPSYYATATAVSNAQTTADAAMSNATSALTKIDTLITDITAIKYVTALPSNPNSKTLYLIKKG